MNNSEQQFMNVGIIGISGQAVNMLELYFSRQCRGSYVLTNLDLAQAIIIDLDTVNGQKVLDKHRANHPHHRIVAFTAREMDIDGVQLLSKPIKLKELSKALESIQSGIDHALPDGKKPVAEVSPKVFTRSPVAKPVRDDMQHRPTTEKRPPPDPVTISDPGGRHDAHPDGHVIEKNQPPVHDCCIARKDVDLADKAAIKKLFYDPMHSFQGLFLKALQLSRLENKAVEFKLGEKNSILFLPAENSLISDVSDRLLRAYCVQSTYTERNFTITELDESKATRLSNAAVQKYTIESLLWKTALWTSRGRVPVGTDLKGKVSLANWPNFTRLASVPQFLRIAAFWSQGEHSLHNTAAALNIPQHYTLSLYSACHAIKLATIESRSAKTAGEITSSAHSTAKKEHRSFFGKMLAHLRGAQ